MAMSARLIELLRKQLPGGGNESAASSAQDLLRDGVLQDEQRERLEIDRQILESPDSDEGGVIEREAKHQLRRAAEASLRRLHVIQHGRCPQCGDHLRQHLFASVCDSCGWNVYDTPRHGGVRIHLSRTGEVIEGEVGEAVRRSGAKGLVVLRIEGWTDRQVLGAKARYFGHFTR